MKTEYLIKKVLSCDTCKGKGEQRNPIWKPLDNNQEWAKDKTGPEVDRYVREYFEKAGFSEIPKQKIVCMECDGVEPRVESWISLEEAASFLAVPELDIREIITDILEERKTEKKKRRKDL